MSKNTNLFIGGSLVLVSGVMVSLAWSSSQWIIALVFVGFVPLFYAAHYIWNYSVTLKICAGYIFFLLLHFIKARPTGLSISFTLSVFFFNSLICSLPWILYVVLKNRYKYFLSVCIFICSWLSVEYLQTHWVLSFPWFTLGNSLSGITSYIQWFEYTGVAGGSLWILSINALCFFIITQIKSKKRYWAILVPSVILAGCLIIPIIISGAIFYNPIGKSLSVVIVSANENNRVNISNPYIQLIRKSIECIDSTTNLIIWPESATKRNVIINKIDDSTTFSYIKNDVKKFNRIWVIGSNLKDDISYYNSAIILSDSSIARYDKMRLVPFVEFMPFQNIFTRPHFSSSENDNTFFTSGGQVNTVPSSLRVIICYEALFGEYVAFHKFNDLGIIAILSNESWCMNSSKELLQIAALRAIETRKYIVRSTINGIPAIINPIGEIVKHS